MFRVRSSEFEFRSEHCLNTPSEHVFTDQKKGGGAFGAAPFFAYEEVSAGLKKDVHFFPTNSFSYKGSSRLK